MLWTWSSPLNQAGMEYVRNEIQIERERERQRGMSKPRNDNFVKMTWNIKSKWHKFDWNLSMCTTEHWALFLHHVYMMSRKWEMKKVKHGNNAMNRSNIGCSTFYYRQFHHSVTTKTRKVRETFWMMSVIPHK